MQCLTETFEIIIDDKDLWKFWIGKTHVRIPTLRFLPFLQCAWRFLIFGREWALNCKCCFERLSASGKMKIPCYSGKCDFRGHTHPSFFFLFHIEKISTASVCFEKCQNSVLKKTFIVCNSRTENCYTFSYEALFGSWNHFPFTKNVRLKIFIFLQYVFFFFLVSLFFSVTVAFFTARSLSFPNGSLIFSI